MSEHKRLIILIMIMSIVSLVSSLTATYLLYTTAFNLRRERLIEIVQAQARMIEAIGRFDAVHSKEDHPEGATAATISQVVDAHKNFKKFGQTGDIILIRRAGNNINFLLNHTDHDHEHPKTMDFQSRWAEPLRRALSGKSGTMIGYDYRGIKVLAAYESEKGKPRT